MSPQQLDQRLKSIERLRCSVLPLAEALRRLQAQDLPPRSVAITFDDGTYDFYKQAYPLLKKRGFPVTVYQTTYYSDYQAPVFNLICSYMLWKRRADQLAAVPELGLKDPLDLRTEGSRHRIVRTLIERSERDNLTGAQKNEIAKQLAAALGIDYAALCATRILQLMNAQEVAEIARNGVDMQLHTHRHRTPEDEQLFRREIEDNRSCLEALTGKLASHFCYPSGIYREQFFTWLKNAHVNSATTCDAGLASHKNNPYLLPRFVDTTGRTQLEYESWLSGVGSMLAVRRVAPQQYVLPED
jgi:peptidoglycan/xylan/chitin deacetylase (PgdA/CDA1 family)